MSFSNYLENELLDHLLKTGAYSVPTNIYIALSTADPGESGGTIAEPSGNNYARTACNTWDTAASGQSANTGAVTFPQASGSWGTISHFALYDASTSGNMLAYGSLAVSKAIGSGDTAQFAAGAITIGLN